MLRANCSPTDERTSPARHQRGRVWRRSLLLFALFTASVLTLRAESFAQFAEDDDSPWQPGLVARYDWEVIPTAGARRRPRQQGTAWRIDSQPSYTTAALPEEASSQLANVRVTWAGLLLVRAPGEYQLHLHTNGSTRITIDGDVAFETTASESADWASSEPIDLTPGFREFAVEFETGSQPNAELNVFWSSAQFQLEPIPSHLLFHEVDAPLPEASAEQATDGEPIQTVAEIAQLARGELLYDAHRCGRCHDGDKAEASEAAPALWGVTVGLNRDWLVEKLLHKNPEAADAKMPSFGFDAEQANAIAAYLESLGSPFEPLEVPTPKINKKNPPPSGQELLLSLGCLACHRVGEFGNVGPYGGGDLTQIARKRSPEWLATWLADPNRVNPQHRMPAYRLSPTERGLLVQALSELGETSSVTYGETQNHSPPRNLVETGKGLVKEFGCANCHKIPAIEADRRTFPTLTDPVEDWERSCLGSQADLQRKRPHFPQADIAALKAYVTHRSSQQSDLLDAHRAGQRVLARNNCLACHEREQARGIVETAGTVAQKIPELRGQSEGLIPPNLTAIGDKLKDEALASSVDGGFTEPRLPWLKVRMPKFQHTPAEKEALVAYLIDEDRIPAEAPKSLELQPWEGPIDELLLVGRGLVGASGFSCIACHRIGDYEPRNVALGTRGANLQGIGDRLRPEFFLRWCRSPLRVMPGIEMPSYLRPAPNFLNDDLDAQFSALWAALNDPRFEPPTNPTQVEQLWVVEAGERPRILRDVFTVQQGKKEQYVARSFAVGFNNGHSLLLDLDRLTLRGWALGDFARQRTVGKSWYWDLAGTPLVSEFDETSELVLVEDATGAQQELMSTDPARIADLQSYRVSGDDDSMVELHYLLPIQIGTARHTIEMVETLRAISAENSSGWERRWLARRVPAGFHLAFRLPAWTSTRFGARLVPISSATPEGVTSATEPVHRFETVQGNQIAGVKYTIDRRGEPGRPKVLKPVPPTDGAVTTLPGYTGTRLPLPTTIMPTAIGWTNDGTLAFTSLKGEVFLARDQDGDGIEETLTVFEEGLAAPFGVLADGKDLLVAHKAELLRLRDLDGDGRCDERIVVADGWGYSDNYHDWVTGPVSDAAGNLYVGLGSNYSQPKRPEPVSRWRGKVLKISPDGKIEPYAHELRYPVGIAIDGSDQLFVSDQQGVQNTFNEINHILPGRRYGVPGIYDPPSDEAEAPVAIQIPHPWTRSVNGIFFLPDDLDSPFAGHGIGCEYNERFLTRFTFQEVGGELQGATYAFSRRDAPDETTFLGPISGAVAPNGDIYIGSIHDSGWLGGQNTGELVRLQRNESELPNGIRELRAVKEGFEIEFLRPVDRKRASDPASYSLTGYTRVFSGSYASEDTGRFSPEIETISVSEDGRRITLHTRGLKAKYVYELNCSGLDEEAMFPASAAYTLNKFVGE